jgi:ribosomal protein S18 acetylase RimI-like enzyme
MLSKSIEALIRDEQARSGGAFIQTRDLDAYLAKLDAHAEIVSDVCEERCRGFVAFYCNDDSTKQAFITLVLTDRRDRGRGIARSLIGNVLDVARRRGFTSCRLEVGRDNTAAQAMYRSLGFGVVEDRGDKALMEIAL